MTVMMIIKMMMATKESITAKAGAATTTMMMMIMMRILMMITTYKIMMMMTTTIQTDMYFKWGHLQRRCLLQHTIEQWRIFFFITVAVFLAGAIVFALLAKGEQLWWATESFTSSSTKQDSESDTAPIVLTLEEAN